MSSSELSPKRGSEFSSVGLPTELSSLSPLFSAFSIGSTFTSGRRTTELVSSSIIARRLKLSRIRAGKTSTRFDAGQYIVMSHTHQKA